MTCADKSSDKKCWIAIIPYCEVKRDILVLIGGSLVITLVFLILNSFGSRLLVDHCYDKFSANQTTDEMNIYQCVWIEGLVFACVEFASSFAAGLVFVWLFDGLRFVGTKSD